MSRELQFPSFWRNGHVSSLGISHYIDSECSPEEAKKIWQHFLKCSKCRLKMGNTAQVDRIARKAMPRTPKDALAKILARLRLKE